VALLSEGQLAQVGAPEQVYLHPANAAVARFLGYNVVTERGKLIAVAPEDVELGPPDADGTRGSVSLNGFAGRDRIVEVTLPGGERVECRSSGSGAHALVGSQVSVRWRRSVALAPAGRTAD
jgi:ABC-type Fe3+/spermidine/putrescine transport system ATPase subunit